MASYDASYLTEVDAQDEQLMTFGMVRPMHAPPTDLNFAEDPATRQLVRTEVAALVNHVRHQRASLEDEWRAVLRMELMSHDQGSRRYFGRHDVYLPLWTRIKHAKVSALSRGLFPSDEYLDVTDRRSGDPEKAKPVKTLIQWEFERNARVRLNMKPFLSQWTSFGASFWKRWYKKELRSEGRAKAQGTLSRFAQVNYGQYSVEGFAVQAPSIFNTYLWPTNVCTIEEATMVFQDITMSRKTIEDLIKKGYFLNGKAALSAPEPTSAQVQANALHGMYHSSDPAHSTASATPLGEQRTLTEVWTFLILPQEAYVPGEDQNCPVPVRIVLAGNEPVVIKRNPFIDQRPPFEFQAQNAFPGMAYGYGEGKMTFPLQVLANDFFNQTADVGSYILDPVIKRVPHMMKGPMGPRHPGRIWDMLDLNALDYDRPPWEMLQHGLTMASTVQGMAQDYAGTPQQFQGIAGGKQAKTATQAQILQRNTISPIQDEVQDLEEGILIPSMRACWMLNQQFRSQAVIAAVAGQTMRIEPWQMDIEADMRWMASSQAINQAQRAQNAMMLLQAVGPMIPYLNQIGYFVDPVALLNRIFSDGFGFRGFSDFIRKVGPTMGPGGAIPPGLAGAQQTAFDRARSSVEQANGIGEPGMEMQPGEGEEFMDVRNGADNLAALNGGLNGRMAA